MRGIPRGPRLPRLPRKEAPVEKLSDNHWIMEGYTQRLTVKSWKHILLDGADKMFFEGGSRRLVAKRLGFGIVEVSKAPIKEGKI